MCCSTRSALVRSRLPLLEMSAALARVARVVGGGASWVPSLHPACASTATQLCGPVRAQCFSTRPEQPSPAASARSSAGSASAPARGAEEELTEEAPFLLDADARLKRRLVTPPMMKNAVKADPYGWDPAERTLREAPLWMLLEAEREEIRLPKTGKRKIAAEERVGAELVMPAIDSKGRAHAVGRRKTSVANVWVFPGDGAWSVNGRDMVDYFPRMLHRRQAMEPFLATQATGAFSIYSTVNGGGPSGQAGALKHGVAKALAAYDPYLKPILKQREWAVEGGVGRPECSAHSPSPSPGSPPHPPLSSQSACCTVTLVWWSERSLVRRVHARSSSGSSAEVVMCAALWCGVCSARLMTHTRGCCCCLSLWYRPRVPLPRVTRPVSSQPPPPHRPTTAPCACEVADAGLHAALLLPLASGTLVTDALAAPRPGGRWPDRRRLAAGPTPAERRLVSSLAPPPPTPTVEAPKRDTAGVMAMCDGVAGMPAPPPPPPSVWRAVACSGGPPVAPSPPAPTPAFFTSVWRAMTASHARVRVIRAPCDRASPCCVRLANATKLVTPMLSLLFRGTHLWEGSYTPSAPHATRTAAVKGHTLVMSGRLLTGMSEMAVDI